MAAHRFRLEVWDRTGTTRRAIFGAVMRAERRQVLQGEETIALDVPADDPAAGELVTGAVLRLQREGSATDATLWRLASARKARRSDGALTLRLEADALWMDLRHGLVRQPLADGRPQFTFGLVGLTPEQWLEDFILPGYDGDAASFQLGTVEPVDPVDLSFDRTSPLAALRALEAAVPGGAETQFRLSADGSHYLVDLLSRVGRTSGTAELRYTKNLRGLERLGDEADVQTRLYAAGAGLLTLADARWTVDAVGGVAGARVLTFEELHPAHEDGVHVGRWFYVEGKGAYPITASDADAGTLTVDDTALPALAVDDAGVVATTEEGAPLPYLESPAGVSEYGVRVGDLVAGDVPDAINLVPNGDLSAETAGRPTGWSDEGAPAVLKSTSPVYGRHGGVAWQITAAEDGEGLVSDAFEITHPPDRPYTALRVGLTILAGKVRVELRHSNGITYPVSERPSSEGVGVYLELSAGPVHDEPLPEGTAQIAIVAHKGAAEFVLDAAMVTPVLASDVPAFVAGSGAHLLWRRAAAELAERRLPRVEYRVDVVDLYRVDPDAFAFHELRLGDDVRLRDPDIARETVRIVELAQDLVRAEATKVVLAASPRLRVADPYRPPAPPIGGKQPGTGTGGGQSHRPASPDIAPTVASDGTLTARLTGDSRTASHRVVARTDREPTIAEVRAGAALDGRAVSTATLATLDPSQRAYIGALAYAGAAGAGMESELAVVEAIAAPAVPDVPGEAGTFVRVSDVRYRAVGTALQLEILLEYGTDTGSIRVQYERDDLSVVDYTFDVASNESNVLHTIEDGLGGIELWEFEDSSPGITLTPYPGSAGSGTAGRSKDVTGEEPSETGSVGARVRHDVTTYQADYMVVAGGLTVTTDVDGRPVVQVEQLAEGGLLFSPDGQTVGNIVGGQAGQVLRWTGSQWMPGTVSGTLPSPGGAGRVLISEGDGGWLPVLAPDGTVLKGAGGIGAQWAALTEADLPSHGHAWGDITGEPVYATRWPTPAEVGALPTTGGTLTGSVTATGFYAGDNGSGLSVEAGIVTGEDLVLLNRQGSQWQDLRLLDAGSQAASGLLLRNSANSGASWQDLLLVTGSQFEYLGTAVSLDGHAHPEYAPLAGATFTGQVRHDGVWIHDSDTNLVGAYFTRQGTVADQFLRIGVDDGSVIFLVNNDEESAILRIDLEATDTEGGGGAAANSGYVQFQTTPSGVVGLINGGTIWHSNNDGATSGLHADLLDGQHGSYYRDADNINAGVLALARGGTGSGSGMFPDGSVVVSDGSALHGLSGASNGQILRWNGSAWVAGTISTSDALPNPTGPGSVLHADGSGTGWTQTVPPDGTFLKGAGGVGLTFGSIDEADLPSHSHAWGDITGEPVYATRWPTPAEVGALSTSGGTLTGRLTIANEGVRPYYAPSNGDALGSDYPLGMTMDDVGNNDPTFPYGYGTLLSFKYAETRFPQLYTTHDGAIRAWLRTWYNDHWNAWVELYHTGNDGTGSLLDADLLDGNHGSYYRDASNINAGTLAVARGGTGTGVLADGGVIVSGGGSLASLLGTSVGDVLRWNGNAWYSGTVTGTLPSPGGLGRVLISDAGGNWDPVAPPDGTFLKGDATQGAVWGSIAEADLPSHTHAWSQITGEPVYTTRWPTPAEVGALALSGGTLSGALTVNSSVTADTFYKSV